MDIPKKVWRNCSTCKKPIYFGDTYQVCGVSTCKKNVYCSMTCWDVHVPVMNHKNAWAEDKVAPLHEQLPSGGKRIMIKNPGATKIVSSANKEIPRDILIVASKLKTYVKARFDLNTSSNVLERLSDIVREVCENASESAKVEGRKTLMDRDFK